MDSAMSKVWSNGPFNPPLGVYDHPSGCQFDFKLLSAMSRLFFFFFWMIEISLNCLIYVFHVHILVNLSTFLFSLLHIKYNNMKIGF